MVVTPGSQARPLISSTVCLYYPYLSPWQTGDWVWLLCSLICILPPFHFLHSSRSYSHQLSPTQKLGARPACYKLLYHKKSGLCFLFHTHRNPVTINRDSDYLPAHKAGGLLPTLLHRISPSQATCPDSLWERGIQYPRVWHGLWGSKVPTVLFPDSYPQDPRLWVSTPDDYKSNLILHEDCALCKWCF